MSDETEYEYRVVRSNGGVAYTQPGPILTWELADAWVVLLNDRERSGAPHALHRRAYVRSDWEEVT